MIKKIATWQNEELTTSKGDTINEIIMVASLNLGFYKRKFAEDKRAHVINKRDLLFLSGKQNSNIGAFARFMTFHGRMNSEVTVYAIGLECEVSHYSNRRTVSGDVLAWFYWRLRLTGESSCEVSKIDISMPRAGIPGLGGIKARGLGQGRSRCDGSIETIGARARRLPLAQHVSCAVVYNGKIVNDDPFETGCRG